MDKSRLMIAKILSVVMLLVMTVACSPKPEELILGKWGSKDQESYEFMKDGTFSFTDIRLGTILPGKWSMQGENTIEIQFLIREGNEQFESFSVNHPDKDTLVISGKGGEQILTRLGDPNKDALASVSEDDDPGAHEELILLGKWAGKFNDSIEFMKDGTLSITDPTGNILPGKWSMQGENTIVIQIWQEKIGEGSEQIESSSVNHPDKDTLILDNQKNEPMIFTRISDPNKATSD